MIGSSIIEDGEDAKVVVLSSLVVLHYVNLNEHTSVPSASPTWLKMETESSAKACFLVDRSFQLTHIGGSYTDTSSRLLPYASEFEELCWQLCQFSQPACRIIDDKTQCMSSLSSLRVWYDTE